MQQTSWVEGEHQKGHTPIKPKTGDIGAFEKKTKEDVFWIGTVVKKKSG